MSCQYIIDPRTKKRIAVRMKLTLQQAILIHDLILRYGGSPEETARGWANEIRNIIQTGMGIQFSHARTTCISDRDNYLTPESKTMIDEFAAQLEVASQRQNRT